MTLNEIVIEIARRTDVPEQKIIETIARNWPDLLDFTPTQAKLLEQQINKTK